MMLILQLNPNDYVMIGDNIMVKLIKDSKSNFKLAIDAPKEFNIVRSKLYEKQLMEEMENNLKITKLREAKEKEETEKLKKKSNKKQRAV